MRVLRVLHGLGTLFKLFSFSLLIPFLASLIWDPPTPSSGIPNPFTDQPLPLTTVAFFLTFLVILLLGFVFTTLGAERLEELRDREGYAVVGFAWLVLAALGSIPFLLTRSTLSPINAYFETMSGLTTTGATVLALENFDTIAPSIHVWRATLEYVGGLGIIVLAVAVIAQLTEGAYRLMAAETPGGTVTRLKPKITQTAAALWTLYLSLSALCYLVLITAMHYTGRRLEWKEAALDALITTFTTVATGGFSNRAESIAYYDSSLVTWAITIFMVAAGVNFNLYWIAFHGRPGRLFRNPEFKFYIATFLTAAVVMTGILVFANRPVGSSIEDGFFQTAAFLTTTGYTTVDHNRFPDAGRLLILLLMFTGASVGSTSGALKGFRIMLLLRLTRRELQKLLHPHAFATVKLEGRVLPDEAIRRVVVFFFSYVTLVILGSFLYAFLGLDFISAVSASASMVGNIGPGLGTVASSFQAVPDAGKIAGILLMWMGRLEIFTVLVLFVPATYRD